MSQRVSGYERKERDFYETPVWVTECLCSYIADCTRIWEPAAGNGAIARFLTRAGFHVIATDLAMGFDFLEQTNRNVHAIVTNPPYTLADEFVERSLDLTRERAGKVAMLLRIDYDSASTRKRFFAHHPAWAKKIVLMKRIQWFVGPSSPSENHAWYLWDWNHKGPATLAYEP